MILSMAMNVVRPVPPWYMMSLSGSSEAQVSECCKTGSEEGHTKVFALLSYSSSLSLKLIFYLVRLFVSM